MSRMSAASLTPTLDVRLGHLAQLQPEREVVADRHVRIQGVALEDHRDVAILRGHIVDDPLADPQLAGGDLLEAGDHPQARRLAAARRSDQDHEFAVVDLEVEVVHRQDVAIFLGDVIERDSRHSQFLLTTRAIARPCTGR